MQVCLNGHVITDSYNRSSEFRKKFCTICGEKTTTTCSNCGREIKGDYYTPNVLVLGSAPSIAPGICEYCGKDFPWREKQNKIREAITRENRNAALLIDNICTRFHLFVKQLRQRHDNRDAHEVNDEYDVQDLLHALLKLYFDDIRTEEWNPSYAGHSTRSDFLIKDEKIVIEVKKTRKSLKTKELGDQLVIDAAHYKKHPDCKVLYCFVYDPEGYINNPKGLENDLAKDGKEFTVKVNIIPKGH